MNNQYKFPPQDFFCFDVDMDLGNTELDDLLFKLDPEKLEEAEKEQAMLDELYKEIFCS